MVVPAIDEPMPGAVRCMRADLVTAAPLAAVPLFSLRDTAADGTQWQCSVWQCDNPSQTFVASKTLQRPPPNAARAPVY